jgi:hypothetical protein
LFGIIDIDNTLLLKGEGGHFSKYLKNLKKRTFIKKSHHYVLWGQREIVSMKKMA